MKILDVMTPRPETCGKHTDLAAVAMMMWRNDCGVVPVVDDAQKVIGMITDRDICIATATRHRSPETLKAGELLARRPVTVRPDDDVHVALVRMREEQVRRLPVVDPEGRIEGLVSINDLMMHANGAGKRGSVLTTAEVFSAMKSICSHSVPVRIAKPQMEPVHAS